METVGSYEAKTHFSALLNRVAKGEKITITKHGVPIAVLIPPEPGKCDIQAAIDAIKEFGKGRRLPEGMSIRDMIEEGRRY
ncbi:MAG: type II toxin-antitoxin system prevent-host-death family antitoxin [Armatimonadota bacterium]|nr:type II toxin-antitoxin system prevent-host-death family antitoxin [bacterium]